MRPSVHALLHACAHGPHSSSVQIPSKNCAPVTPRTRSMQRLAPSGTAERRTSGHSARTEAVVSVASTRWSNCKDEGGGTARP